LNVGSDSDCLIGKGREFQTLGAETRKAREPNDKLCPGTSFGITLTTRLLCG